MSATRSSTTPGPRSHVRGFCAALCGSALLFIAGLTISSGQVTQSQAQGRGRCASCGDPSHVTAQHNMMARSPVVYERPLPPLLGVRHHDTPVAALPAAGARPFDPYKCGVTESTNPCAPEPSWENRGPEAWQSVFAHGGYIGPHRTAHVPAYRLRVDDQMNFTYRIARQVGPEYKLNVNDQIRVESAVDKDLDRTITIAPDGMIVLPYVGSILAADRTVVELRKDLEKRYTEFYVEPSITVTPTLMGSRLEDLRSAVDARASADIGGLGVRRRIMPDGTVSLPGISLVPAQGLTIEELRREVNERYRELVDGMDVTPDLRLKAPTFAYVLGEVTTPQRIPLDRPTTAMMAISQAGGANIGGNLRQIIIFRRTEDWRLIATKLDLQGAIWGKQPIPSDELFLRDADIVLIPKRPIQIADDFINLIFTQGIYGIFPNQGFSISSTL